MKLVECFQEFEGCRQFVNKRSLVNFSQQNRYQNSIETSRTSFLFLLENTVTKKRKLLDYFDHQTVNFPCSYFSCVGLAFGAEKAKGHSKPNLNTFVKRQKLLEPAIKNFLSIEGIVDTPMLLSLRRFRGGSTLFRRAGLRIRNV